MFSKKEPIQIVESFVVNSMCWPSTQKVLVSSVIAVFGDKSFAGFHSMYFQNCLDHIIYIQLSKHHQKRGRHSCLSICLEKRVMEGKRRIFQHFSTFLIPSILSSKPTKYSSVVRTFTFPFDKVFYKEDRWNWYFTKKERKKTAFAEK